MRLAHASILAALATLLALPAGAGMASCRLKYQLEGWSFFYRHSTGSGSVHCSNGQSAQVSLELHAGGLSFGRSEIDSGRGRFSAVKDIDEIFGTYASLEGHAGATRAAEGRVVTKGKVSLSLSGTGRGVGLGVVAGGFTIRRR